MRIRSGWFFGVVVLAAAGCGGSQKSVATTGGGGSTSGTGSTSGSSSSTSSSSGGLVCSDAGCAPQPCSSSVPCPAGLTCTMGYCSNPTSCASACAPDQVCVGGNCVNDNPCGEHELVCGTGATAYCANLSQDANNCGACGNACPSGEKCARGACATSCPGDETVCGNLCTNLMDDDFNCGSCGASCIDAGKVCSNGTCGPSCAAPYQTVCGENQARYCADVQNDPLDCGACGTTCDAGTFCSEGACAPRCEGVTDVDCNGICVNLLTDEESCGACGTACGASTVCYGGACAASCGSPDSTCMAGATNFCADLLDDPRNCGACGQACAPGLVCGDGACAATCQGASGTLCEGLCVHLDSDNQNCGACGNVCDGGFCDGFGTCASTCGSGFTLCGSGEASHCADLASDDSDCGTCGNGCGPGVACGGAACGGSPDGGDAGVDAGPDGGPDAGPPPSCGDAGCGDGLTCYGGACVSQTCADLACPPGFGCIDGGCEQGSCAGVGCDAGSSCGNGSCYPTSCGSSSCADGGLCWQGSCVEPDCAGVTCTNGQVCSGGHCWPTCAAGCSAPSVCFDGACEPGCTVGTSTSPAGSINPANLCQVCDPTLDPGTWSPLGGGNTCDTGEQVCVGGACEQGCSIGAAGTATGYAEGATDATDECLVCDAQINGNGWSAGNDNQACGTGEFCQGGACLSGCEVGGFVQPNAADPGNPCQTCQPLTSATSYSFLTDGTPCTDSAGGTYCVSGECVPVCLIASAVVSSGAVDPSVACKTCQPQLDSAGYSAVSGAVPPGGTCPSIQDVCQSGSCTAGCYIDGGYVAPLAFGPDAGSGVQCCAPAYSTAEWSPQFQEEPYGVGAGFVQLLAATIQGSTGPALLTSNPHSVSLLPNQGDGTFGALQTFDVGDSGAQFVGAGDINGDGIPDLVALESSGYYFQVYFGQDGGGFGPATPFEIPNYGETPMPSDAYSYGYAPLGMAPHFFASGAPGAFLTWSNYDNWYVNVNVLTDAGIQIVQHVVIGIYWIFPAAGVQAYVGDLNGDGLDDLALTTDDAVLSAGITVMINGAGSLGSPSYFFNGTQTSGLAVGSFFSHHYGSGAPYADLATSVPIGDGGFELALLANDGTGNFTPAGSNVPTPGSFPADALASADVNGDGFADVIALSYPGGVIQVFFGDGQGGLTPGPTFSVNASYGNSGNGNLLAAGAFGASGAGAFFGATNSSSVALFTDVCK